MNRLAAYLLFAGCFLAWFPPFALAQSQTNFVPLKKFEEHKKFQIVLSKVVFGSGGQLYGVAVANSTNFLFSIDTNGQELKLLRPTLDQRFTLQFLFPASDGSIYSTGSRITRYVPTGNTEDIVRSAAGTTYSGITESANGTIYGAANTISNSWVFRMDKDGANYEVLRTFSTNSANEPISISSISYGRDNHIYIAALRGGSDNLGVIGKLNSDGSVFNIVENLTNTAHAYAPSFIMQASDGNFYGLASAVASGETIRVIFKISPVTAGLQILYQFSPWNPELLSQTGGACQPADSLVEGNDGNLYGTYRLGGKYGGGGAFRVTPSGIFSIIHDFKGPTNDGFQPSFGLVADSNRKLYGVTLEGGASGGGAIFSLNDDGSNYRLLHTLPYFSLDSRHPYGTPLVASDGLLYGVASRGGSNDFGTIFRMDVHGQNYEILHHFAYARGDGALPLSGLTEGLDGKLYGTTSRGGSNHYGTVFSLNKDGSGYQVLHHFPAFEGDGYRPMGKLLYGSDGFLYGIASQKYASYRGVTFRLSKDGTSYTIIHASSYEDASITSPRNALTEGVDGSLYGPFLKGGGIFRMNKDGTGFTTITNGCSDEVTPLFGQRPTDLIQVSNGMLYAASEYSLFNIQTNGSGLSFLAEYDSFSAPLYLSKAVNDTIFGSSKGGFHVTGTVFSFSPADNSFIRLHAFDRYDGNGHTPFSSVYPGSDGALYGAVRFGGNEDNGVIYKLYSYDSHAAPLPVITQQPFNRVVGAGIKTTFSVVAQSPGGVRYQWFYNGNPISDGTNGVLVIQNVQQVQAGNYFAVATGMYGCATSRVVSLTVTASAPTITSQPTDQTKVVGSTFTITASARGSEPMTYYWKRISPSAPFLQYVTSTGALTISNAQNSMSGTFLLVVSNAHGSANSQPFEILIGSPVITLQPKSQSVYAGANTKFAVGANGIAPLQFQWFQNGSPIPNATDTSLKFLNVQSNATYYAVVQNSAGAVTSRVASLTVDTRFVEYAGTYNGLFYNTNQPGFESSGFITLEIKSSAFFSGKIYSMGITNTFKGTLNPEGVGEVTITRLGLPLVFIFTVTNESGINILRGVASGAGWSSELMAEQTALPAPGLAANYTMVLHGTEGHSYVIVNVDSNSIVKATGKLADGSSWKQTLPMSASGKWPFFSTASSRTLLGWLDLAAEPVQIVYWIGNAATNEVQFLSSRWEGSSANPLTFTNGQLLLDFGSSATTNSILIRTNGAISVMGANPNRIKLGYSRTTGELNGSFIDVGTGITNKLQGAFLQHQDQAAGFSVGPSQIGSFSIYQ